MSDNVLIETPADLRLSGDYERDVATLQNLLDQYSRIHRTVNDFVEFGPTPGAPLVFPFYFHQVNAADQSPALYCNFAFRPIYVTGATDTGSATFDVEIDEGAGFVDLATAAFNTASDSYQSTPDFDTAVSSPSPGASIRVNALTVTSGPVNLQVWVVGRQMTNPI